MSLDLGGLRGVHDVALSSGLARMGGGTLGPGLAEELAVRACMSPRHFAREFHAETGVTPAKAVERIRVEAARTALDNGAPSIQRVALDCGFGDAERMRRSFVRLLGVRPSMLRRAG